MIDTYISSSKTVEWETPQWLFDKYNAIYGFDLDACATPENAKCKRYFTEEDNALNQEWTGIVWMNPPHGRKIGKWVSKAYKSAQNGAVVVCLLPSRTDTAWWHDYCMRGDIEFIRGRLKFGSASENAPFPSAIVVFSPV